MRSFLCFFRFFAVWNTEFFSRMVIELLGGVRAPFQVQSRCQIDHGLGCPISRTEILKKSFHEFGCFHQLGSILNVVVMLCGKNFHGSCPKWPFHYGFWWKEPDFVLTLILSFVNLRFYFFFTLANRSIFQSPSFTTSRFATFLCTGQVMYEFGSRGACSKAALIFGSFRDWLGLLF